MKIKFIFLISFLILSKGIYLEKEIIKNTNKAKPNFLFIAVDDLNDWVGFLGGNPQTITPNLNKLANESLVFERAYCAASVCNPSRAAIMSGLKPSSTGIYQNGQEPFEVELFKNSLMLPQYLSKYGYKTYSRGKIYHTPETGKNTWDEWSNVQGSYGNSKKQKGFLENGIPLGEMSNNMDWAATDAHITSTPDFLNAKWAADLLKQNFEKPFFIGLGIFRPHLEWKVPKEFYDLFPIEKIVLPKVLESDLDDLDKEFKATKEYITIKKYGKEKEAVQAYLASIAYADYCIGIVLDALAKSDYSKNTIVILWGDHGWHLGEKLRYKKFTLWEKSTRVPLLIKAPGVTKPKSRTKATVNLLDLYPTILELANLPKNDKNEGNSIFSVLKKPKIKWDYPSLTQMGKDRNTIRTDKWRYIRYENGSEELYNHETDSLEWNNLANNKDYALIKREMSTKMDQILKK
jgi:arylsulfatase A-like enzyme